MAKIPKMPSNLKKKKISKMPASYLRTVEPNLKLSIHLLLKSMNNNVSFPSETTAAYAPNAQLPPVLLVSAFDRLQRSSLFWADVGPVGTVLRMNLRQMNSFDTIVSYAHSLRGLGYPFVTVAMKSSRQQTRLRIRT